MKRALLLAVLTAAVVVGAAVALATYAVHPARATARLARLQALSPGGRLRAVVHESDASVHLVDTHTGKTLAVAHVGDAIASLRFSRDGRHVYATVRDDPHLRSIDVRTGAILVLGER